ncbi:30S ribosomal protein S3 [Candidatus Woesearchaeota archaeon]|nr:30S ribosomal protein S3 [Candidatus Woesearchaeota archaeon]
MIERQFIARKIKEFKIEEFISNTLDKDGYSHTEIQRTPLGERIIIHTSKPGLIVGRRGSKIKDLTEILKTKFKMENPQVEVAEVINPNLSAKTIAKSIVHTFERFGPKRFKSLGYQRLQDIINSGALGAEIIISGRGIPSSRAKSWRFSAGYLKKSGDIAENFVNVGYAVAHLKSGSVGVKVIILTPDIKLPDKITLREIEKVPLIVEPIENKMEIKEEVVLENTETEKHQKKKPVKSIKPKSKKKNGNTEK